MEEQNIPIDALKSKGENLTEHVTDYVETYLKLSAVNVTEKATGVATVTLTATLLSIFCLFVFLFTGIGIAIWLGELWTNMKAGYFAVAGFYVICAIGFVLLRKQFILPYVRNHIIRKLYE